MLLLFFFSYLCLRLASVLELLLLLFLTFFLVVIVAVTPIGLLHSRHVLGKVESPVGDKGVDTVTDTWLSGTGLLDWVLLTPFVPWEVVFVPW